MTYTKLNDTGEICYVWGSYINDSNPCKTGGEELREDHYKNNKTITTVYLLDSPTAYKIKQRAFQNCTSLHTICTIKADNDIHLFAKYVNPNDLLWNVSEFDWNCFDKLSQKYSFIYENINMEQVIFWGESFANSIYVEDFIIITNYEQCIIKFSSAMFDLVSTVNKFQIVAHELVFQQMDSLPIPQTGLVLYDIVDELVLNIQTRVPESTMNAIIANYGGIERSPKTIAISFFSKLIYGTYFGILAATGEQQYLSTTHTLKVLGTDSNWFGFNPGTPIEPTQYGILSSIDFSEYNGDSFNIDEHRLNYLLTKKQGSIIKVICRDTNQWINQIGKIDDSWINQIELYTKDKKQDSPNLVKSIDFSINNISIIPEYAFYKNSGLQEIIIPDTIQAIGTNAFNGCVNVSKLYYNAPDCGGFATGLRTNNGNQIFAYLGQEVERGVVDTTKPNMAKGCEIFIGPAVVRLPNGFMYPEGIDIHDVSKNTYPCIRNIKFVDANKDPLLNGKKNTTLQTIGVAAFKYVNRTVWPANYWSFGTFFEQSQKLQVLGSSAFAGVHSIATLYFPDNLVEIGDNCFHECKNLNKIVNTFPASLISIHPRAFGGAQSEDILYNFTWSEHSVQAPNGWCNLLHCKHNYCTYLVYIIDAANKSWILHWFIGTSALDKEHLPSTIRYRYITLPDNIYGVSRHGCYALDIRLPLEYMNSRNEYEIFGINKSAPQIIEDQAFLSTSYVKDNDISQYCSSVKMNLFDTRILGSESIVHLGAGSDAQTTNIMIYHFKNTNINNIQIQQNALSLGSLYHTFFKYNRICGKIYFDKLSDLEYWLFNPNASINNGQLAYRKGWWTMSYCSGVDENENEIFAPITQFVMDSNGVKINNDNNLIINPTITKLNAYSLHNIEIYNWLIDLHHYDIKDSYLFGNNLYLQKDLSDLKFYHIQLINGYNTIETKTKYQNRNTIFTIDQTSNFEVKTLELPYYALANWFSNNIYCGSINTYIVYGGNTQEENDTQQSKLKIYNYNLIHLSLPLTSISDSLNQPNNKILSSFSISTEGYDFSNLQTFKLTQPVNNQKTKYYLNKNSLQNATNLKYVELDYRLTDIGSKVFLNNSKLETIKLIGPDTLTLQDWYNITFDSITSSPFYSITWNPNKDNCKLYINDTEYFKPIIPIGEKANYTIKNMNNEIEYIKYDPKPFYNYPILGLVFDQALDGTFNSQDIEQADSVSLLDITNTLQVIGFNALAPKTYSVDHNVFKVQNNKLPEYAQLKYIILDNRIEDIPRNCFNHFSHPLINGGIGLGKQVQTLGKDSFLNCASYVGEYELIPDENLLTIINSWIIENDNEKFLKDNCITAADFNHLALSNQCNLALYANEKNIITKEIEGLSHKAIYYNNGKFNFLLRYEIQGSYHNKSINLISDQPLTVIDLKAIKIQVSSAYGGRKLNSLTIPWLGTCGDAEYTPSDQYSALKNWFDIKDTQTVKIDTLYIQNPRGIHGFNPVGTTTPVFQNIQLNNLIIEAPRLKPIAEVAHFDTNNINLNSIILKIDEIPTNLLLNNDNLQSINRLQIQPYGVLSKNIPQIIIYDRSLRTPEILTMIINSQYNQFGKNVFNDNLINDYIYYCNSLKDWVRYNSFGDEKSSPVQFCRKFYTNYDIETDVGEIERILRPDSVLYEDNINKWRRFYVNSYSLFNNHQINTIICTHDDATKNEKYTLYDPLSRTTLPQAPFRSNALIEVIADIYHNSIGGLVENKGAQQEQGDIYASQCFKVGINASEAIDWEET